MDVLSVPDLEKIIVQLRQDIGECLLVVETLEFKIGRMLQQEAHPLLEMLEEEEGNGE